MLMVTMPHGDSACVINNSSIERRASSASATACSNIEPRQQQGEFLAAIPGNDQSLVECDQRQGFADRPQTGVALDVAITIIEQLEVIDIDHDQSERLAQFIRVAPGMIQFAIEAAPVARPVRPSRLANSSKC